MNNLTFIIPHTHLSADRSSNRASATSTEVNKKGVRLVSSLPKHTPLICCFAVLLLCCFVALRPRRRELLIDAIDLLAVVAELARVEVVVVPTGANQFAVRALLHNLARLDD